jgi:pimeloyl-ACP methyl ester carboxylesterase
MKSKLIRYACVILSVLALTHVFAQLGLDQPGRLTQVTFRETLEPNEIRQLAATIYGQYGVPSLVFSVDTYDVRYLTTDMDGSLTEVVAQIFVPVYAVPTERPLYVFGSGTTGLADQCAPSQNDSYGFYRPYMLTYASRGFIGIFPDYLGFNDNSRPQLYFNAQAEAHVLLDAIRAVNEFFETHDKVVVPSPHTFVAGYSQGGHAAFAAADLRPEYAPEVVLTGIIGFGATTNVERLLRDGPYYAPYIVQSYRHTYGDALFNPSSILATRWLDTLDSVASVQCVTEAQSFYPFDAAQIYAPAFREALYSDRLGEAFPDIKAILDSNRTGLSGHGIPSLIVQGAQDVIVTNATQRQFVRELCSTGAPVEYLELPGVRHRFTRAAGFEQSIAWMDTLVRGATPPDSCANFQ